MSLRLDPSSPRPPRDGAPLERDSKCTELTPCPHSALLCLPLQPPPSSLQRGLTVLFAPVQHLQSAPRLAVDGLCCCWKGSFPFCLLAGPRWQQHSNEPPAFLSRLLFSLTPLSTASPQLFPLGSFRKKIICFQREPLSPRLFFLCSAQASKPQSRNNGCSR